MDHYSRLEFETSWIDIQEDLLIVCMYFIVSLFSSEKNIADILIIDTKADI